jgi:hypothetical protein
MIDAKPLLRAGDRIAAPGYNFRLLLNWLKFILCLFLATLFGSSRPLHA